MLIDQGLAVYNQGDAYAAYQIWRPLADQANAAPRTMSAASSR
ncbi:MAG: hypothetical protein R3D25_16355 [Geminicoccaceae bacterium]